MAEITTIDYILLPFYLFAIYKIAYYFREKYYPAAQPYRNYFIPALTAKILGAIFIGLIYNYYYGGGDTFNYLFHSQLINATFTESPATWFRLITHQADENNFIDMQAVANMYWYDDIPAYTTSCLGALIGIFCFTKYLVINVIIASITFIGSWLMFITFARQYSHLIKFVALAVLFMPGPIVWGSGLFKDSFCMFAIGCLLYSSYRLFDQREFKLSLLAISLVAVVLLLLIKAYILVALLPFLVLKTILVYKKKASANPKNKPAFYTALTIVLICSFLVAQKAINYLPGFTVNNVLETVKTQQMYLLQLSIKEDGSVYDLGDFDATLSGMIKMIMPAINVTLFRPYLWESKSIIQLFNAFESTGILLLTLYLLFKKKTADTLKAIYTDPNLMLCLCFTLVIAFFVGVSSYNFGTLSRYKIPSTPFYLLFLMILIFQEKPAEDNKIN